MQFREQNINIDLNVDSGTCSHLILLTLTSSICSVDFSVRRTAVVCPDLGGRSTEVQLVDDGDITAESRANVVTAFLREATPAEPEWRGGNWKKLLLCATFATSRSLITAAR